MKIFDVSEPTIIDLMGEDNIAIIIACAVAFVAVAVVLAILLVKHSKKKRELDQDKQ